MKYIIIMLFITGCVVDVRDSTHRHIVEVVNPVTDYCEKLHPQILYPNELERQELITDCMEICTVADNCANIPEGVL